MSNILDSEYYKSQALRNAKEAYHIHQHKVETDMCMFRRSLCSALTTPAPSPCQTLMFDEEAKDSRSASLHAASGSSSSSGATSGFGESYSLANPSIHAGEEIPQPTIFNGKLKGYQLKGMNWLANLYEQVTAQRERGTSGSPHPPSASRTAFKYKHKSVIYLSCVFPPAAGHQWDPGRRDGAGEDGSEHRPVGTPCRGERAAAAQRPPFSPRTSINLCDLFNFCSLLVPE